MVGEAWGAAPGPLDHETGARGASDVAQNVAPDVTPDVTPVAVALVLLGAASMYALNIAGRTYDSLDVTRYAQMVLEMRHRGTLVPLLDGSPYHGAAPIAAWLPYFVSWLTGQLTPFEVRIVPALAAFATVVTTLRFARRASPQIGVIAAAACAISYLATYYARTSRIETLLEFAIAAAIVAFYRSTECGGVRRGAWLALSGGAVALGILAKGPFAVAIVGATLLPFLVWERRWSDLFGGGVAVAAVAALLTAAWLIPYMDYLGPKETQTFFHEFLGRETVAKFQGHLGKVEPFWSYGPEILPRLAPWSVVALVALVRIARAPAAATRLERLAACWLVFPLLVLSASSGKSIRYIVPLIPAFAILSGFEVDRWLRSPSPSVRRVVRNTLVFFGVLFQAGALVAAIGFTRDYGASVWALAIAAVVFAAGAAAVSAALRRRLAASLLGVYVAAAGAVTFQYAALLPQPEIRQHAEYARLADALRPALATDAAPIAAVAPVRGKRRFFSPSTLALYLDNRWIDEFPLADLPDASLVLSPTPIEGRALRAELDWTRRRGQVERWYLYEAVR